MPRDIIPHTDDLREAIATAQPTPRQARRALADALITALRERPQDFSHDREIRPYTLIDRASGQEWWVANGMLSFDLWGAAGCSCRHLTLGTWNTIRAWRAYKQWRRSRLPVEPPQVHEAQRLERANHTARNQG